MKLYGTPPTRALRPIWLLNELGLECEIIPVDIPAGEHRSTEFRTINAFGKVPVLVDGDLHIAESAAISLYLAERYGDARFIPNDVAQRGLMYQWIFFIVTEIEQPLWRDALHSAIYPEEERRPEEISLAKRDCLEALKPLNEHLTDREWLVGSQPSVADFIAAFTLDWADERGLIDEAPALKAFVERMYARDKAPPTIEEGFAALGAGQIPGRFRQAA